MNRSLHVLLASSVLTPMAPAQGPQLEVSDPNVYGFEFQSEFGESVAGLANITRDGLGDVLIGAPHDPAVGAYGKAFLFDGSTGALLRTYSGAPLDINGNFGHDVAAVPDLDGDGDDDVLIGAPGEDAPLSGSGRVYVYRQPNGLPGAEFLYALDSPNPEVAGAFGTAVAGLSDLNGDGLGELLVGAPEESVPGTVDAGRAYVFDGASGTLMHRLRSHDPTADGMFGYNVAGLPDVDGDGIEDVAVTERYAGGGNQAWVHLFSGASGVFLRKLTWSTPLDAPIAGLPDRNGNGAGEIAVGNTVQGGLVQFYDGATGEFLDSASSTIPGPFGSFGWSLANIGDATGDGVDDLLVGAALEPSLASLSGRAYVIDGADLEVFNVLEPPADGGYSHSNERFGWSVGGLPDADGDGLAEYLVGAPGSNLVNDESGGVFWYFCVQQVPALAAVRPGAPANPVVLASTAAPKVGSTWSSSIDHTSFAPGAVLDLFLLSLTTANLSTSSGTLLVGLGGWSLLVPQAAGTSFDFFLPGDCTLLGAQLHVQGFAFDGQVLSATNALDLTLGTHAPAP